LKRVKIIVAVPFTLYFATEVEVQCHNFRKYGYSSVLQVIVFEQGENIYKEYWDKLAERYREVEFFFYRDDSIENIVKQYATYSRPYCLKKHWDLYPDLKNQVIIYLDSDVLFTKHLDFSKYVNDDICYMSRTDYIDADYFKNKRKDVLSFKKTEYDTRDVLNEFCGIVGIDKKIVEDNVANTGGCQYVLKNIDSKFWEDLADHCIKIYMYSRAINQKFFPNEEKGFQSWALADMCGLLWNLWKRGQQTRCPEELGFSWATAKIDMYDKYAFFHNAGTNKLYMEFDGVKHRMFNKSDIRFRTSTITFFDLEYQDLSKDYCSYKYIEAVKEVPDPICKTNLKLY